jgi:hypothetical protein
MNHERIISAYKNYFKDFNSSLSDAEARKVLYVIGMLKKVTQQELAQRVDTNKSYISRIENNRQ